MLKIELSGTSEATCGDLHVKARGMSGPVGKLARALINAGHNPGAQVEVWRNGTLCFKATSLEYWSNYDWTEGEYTQPRRVKYKPMGEVAWNA